MIRLDCKLALARLPFVWFVCIPTKVQITISHDMIGQVESVTLHIQSGDFACMKVQIRPWTTRVIYQVRSSAETQIRQEL